jgi:hypothetical protein
VIRVRFTNDVEEFRSDDRVERQVYDKGLIAEIGERGGGWIIFPLSIPSALEGGYLHLPTAAHAAALESLARSLRVTLEEREQNALMHGSTEPPAPDETTFLSQRHGGAR